MTKLFSISTSFLLFMAVGCGDGATNAEKQNYEEAKKNEISLKFSQGICVCHDVYMDGKDSLSTDELNMVYYNCLSQYISVYTEQDKNGGQIIARKDCPEAYKTFVEL